MQLVGCGGRGDRCGAEEVDGGLHDDGAACGDGELKCHRDADGHLSLGVGGIDAPVVMLRPEHLLFLIDIEETEGGGDALGEICGECGTRDTELQDDDKEKIQHDIEAGTEHQKAERHLTVSDGLQEGGEEIIVDACDDAHADDADVGVGILEDVSRCIHESEQCLHRGYGKRGHHDDDDRGEKDAVRDTALHACVVLCTIDLRGQDGKAGAEALREAEHEKHDGTGGTDRSERIGTDEAPDDDGVRHVVELLEDIADKQRNHEF